MSHPYYVHPGRPWDRGPLGPIADLDDAERLGVEASRSFGASFVSRGKGGAVVRLYYHGDEVELHRESLERLYTSELAEGAMEPVYHVWASTAAGLEGWGPYTLASAKAFARIGSAHGGPRVVTRGQDGPVVRAYMRGEREPVSKPPGGFLPWELPT